jgi:hypothetical protein
MIKSPHVPLTDTLHLFVEKCPHVTTLVIDLEAALGTDYGQSGDSCYSLITRIVFSAIQEPRFGKHFPIEYPLPWKVGYWTRRRFPNLRYMVVENLMKHYNRDFQMWARTEFPQVEIQVERLIERKEKEKRLRISADGENSRSTV